MNLARINESYSLRKERSSYFPKNFKRELVADSTASELRPDVRFARSPVVKLPVWVFSSEGKAIKAKKPVSLKVFRGETLFFVENETLEIYATGESLEEAMRVFNDHLIYFYTHYKDLGWEHVTGNAVRLKKLYQKNFEEFNV